MEEEKLRFQISSNIPYTNSLDELLLRIFRDDREKNSAKLNVELYVNYRYFFRMTITHGD